MIFMKTLDIARVFDSSSAGVPFASVTFVSVCIPIVAKRSD